jgi:hypothetical protein
MTTFDKVCAVVAIPLGFVFMVLGAFGFLMGSSAHFTLPPILGGLPFLAGWAMSVTLIRFWSLSKIPAAGTSPPVSDPLPDPWDHLESGSSRS